MRVEGWIHYQGVDEKPQILLDLVRLNLELLFVFLFNLFDDSTHNLISNVFYMGAAATRADCIDETDLLETALA